MKKANKPRKPHSFIKKFFLKFTVSLLLFLGVYLSKRYLPDVFLYVKSNLTYTPDLSPINEAVKTFIINHSPN